MTVNNPVTNQTTSNQPGAPTSRARTAETIKMPEPIIDPATIIVESSKPSPRMNPVDLSSALAAALAIRSSSTYADLRNTASVSADFFRERFTTRRNYTELSPSVEYFQTGLPLSLGEEHSK